MHFRSVGSRHASGNPRIDGNGRRAFVVNYGANGNVQWVNHIGGKAIGVDIATSRDGRGSVTGSIGNVADSAQ